MVRWLNQPEAILLIDQIMVLAAEEWHKSAQALHESIETHSELEIAQGYARKAKFYAECAHMISQMQTKAEDGAAEFDFHTVEIKPITLTEIPHE